MTDKAELIKRIYLNNKNLSNAEIAAMINSSKRHVRRVLNPIRNGTLKQIKLPKILLFDIETSPMEILTWGLYKQRPPYQNVVKEWSILSWSAKWLFSSEIISQSVTTQEAINREDGSIIKRLWDLVDTANIIVGHNSNKFDIRKANVRFIKNNLPPPSSYQSIDTLLISKRYFAFSSYTLDYLTNLFDLTGKMHTSFDLWKRCIAGDKEALEEMRIYNEQDVRALEDLYIKLRPWIKSHPNLNLYVESENSICPNCGSDNLTFCGEYYTTVSRFNSFRCECGAIGRDKISNLTKEEKERLIVPVAR